MSGRACFLRLAGLAAAMVVGAAQAQAALIYYENFEGYTANLTDLAGQGSWTGSGEYDVVDDNDTGAAVRPTGYANSTVSVSTGSNSAWKAGAADVYVQDVSMDDQTGTLYFSMLVKQNPATSSNIAAPLALRISNDTGTAFGIRGPVGGANDATDVYAFASFDGAKTSTAGRYIQSDAISENTVFLLVLKLSKTGTMHATNYDRLDFWVNPDDTTESLGNGYLGQVSYNSGSSSVAGIQLYSDNHPNKGWYDEIRIGTTFADVVVPEPATLALVCLGAIGMFLRRHAP